MAINVSNGLIGLSVLTGSNSLLGLDSAAITSDTRAARLAKAQFTTRATTPPWKQSAPSIPVTAQVSAIKRMATIIDRTLTGTTALPTDVATAFTTYKALDRLRLLAETAAKTGTAAAERSLLQTAFANGLADLQDFLGTAPGEQLNLAFAQPSRRAESVAVATPATLLSTDVAGRAVSATRDAPLAGMRGDERFSISLSTAGSADVVTVDLSGTPQPPTLDSVAAAINDAIAAVPLRDAGGNVVLDASGEPTPRWSTRFVAEKSPDGWGLAIRRLGTERVAIDQIGAGDTLMVATGTRSGDTAASTRIMRFDSPEGALDRRTLGTVAAIDSDATERARLLAAASGSKTVPGEVGAETNANAIATDAAGFSYVVGTTRGDVGANLSEGNDDLFLTKLDSEGKVMWQRSLGATGAAQGAAVSIGPNGQIVVAGTVSGRLDNTVSDGDMLVAAFDANGDERFATLVRAAGADAASAVAVGADGSIFVGGRAASGGGDAFLARLDANGRLQERRVIDSGGSDGVAALAIDGDGQLLALTREGSEARLRRLDARALSQDLGMLALGTADARAIAVAADGSIAVGGATNGALPGDQVNAPGGGRDGFVARIDHALSGASVTYLGSAGDDQVDSLSFLNGALYAGGRTNGTLGIVRTGTSDGFVSRIDAATGALAAISQFGQASAQTQPVRLSAIGGGDTALGALGLHRGTLTPETSAKLVAQTGLRAGDEFSIRVDGGSLRKIVIGADDTLTTLADRIRLITGSKATVTTPKSGEGNLLRVEGKPGVEIEFVAGAEGKDALARLGIPAARIATPASLAKNAPSVRPGGSFGLDLTRALGIGTAAEASVALARIKDAISVTQTGYRSLYWDDTKAALANGGASASATGTSREQAQLANYQAALTRLAAGPTSIMGF